MREREPAGNDRAGDELVVDLDMPTEYDADAMDALEAETRRIVFNILFVAFTIATVIVVFSLR